MPDFAAFPNPGRGHEARVAFSDADGSWSESADLVALLATVIAEWVGACERDRAAVRLPDGLVLEPQIVNVIPFDERKGCQLSSVIAVSHPRVFVPALFEWQHAGGRSIEAALTSGFEQWVQCDLPPLRDALRADDLENLCLSLEQPDGHPRRIVLGPVLGIVPEASSGAEHESGCPCCMFTHCMDALRGLIHSDGVYGVRLFASRMVDGEVAVDCRVNGADFSAGAEALSAYARTWPRETQVRKQYVIIQTPHTKAN